IEFIWIIVISAIIILFLGGICYRCCIYDPEQEQMIEDLEQDLNQIITRSWSRGSQME
ncbi:hypothetical protein RhiirC2_755787, partial [Rhizophagus irregularis]